MVTIIFDFDEEPFTGYQIADWEDFNLEEDDNNVHIRGTFRADDDSTRLLEENEIVQTSPIEDDGEYLLLVFIKDKGFPFGQETVDLEIDYRDIKVTIEGTTYAWYGVE